MQGHKEKVALGSVLASGGLTLAKAVVGLLSGSLAILSEAGHSAIDFGASLITYFAVRVSGKPADEDHPYGHEKFESIAALVETALLFLLSGIVIWEAGQRLLTGHGHGVEASIWAFAVILGSIVIDFFRARALSNVAKETSSEALEADALHFSSDMWSSLAVLAGLGGVALGFPAADSLAAIIVAVFVLMVGWRLGRRTIDTLTDVAPVGIAERITDITQRIKGVVAVERVRARQVGAKLFAEMTVGVSRALPLDRVAAIKTDVENAIRGELPGAEVNVTTEPRALDNETIMERIMVVARNQGLAVHHVTVHHLRDKLADQPRSRSRPRAFARRSAWNRKQARGRHSRRFRSRNRGGDPHRADGNRRDRRPRRADRAANRDCRDHAQARAGRRLDPRRAFGARARDPARSRGEFSLPRRPRLERRGRASRRR